MIINYSLQYRLFRFFVFLSEFELSGLIQNGQFYESKLSVHHCPSRSGCRAVITKLDGDHVYDVLENFVLSLKVKELDRFP